jgi:DNA-binding transcriptional regulator YdaS (Cro superfamily)
MIYRVGMNTLADHFPSAAELARSCGVSREAARHWLSGASAPSLQHIPAIEAASNGAIRAEDLRPDVEWKRDRKGRITGYTVPVKAA